MPAWTAERDRWLREERAQLAVDEMCDTEHDLADLQDELHAARALVETAHDALLDAGLSLAGLGETEAAARLMPTVRALHAQLRAWHDNS